MRTVITPVRVLSSTLRLLVPEEASEDFSLSEVCRAAVYAVHVTGDGNVLPPLADLKLSSRTTVSLDTACAHLLETLVRERGFQNLTGVLVVATYGQRASVKVRELLKLPESERVKLYAEAARTSGLRPTEVKRKPSRASREGEERRLREVQIASLRLLSRFGKVLPDDTRKLLERDVADFQAKVTALVSETA